MLLDETFRIKPHGSRRWQYTAAGILLLLGTALSLLTLQPSPLPAQQPSPPSPAAAVVKPTATDARSDAAATLKNGKTLLEKGKLDAAVSAFNEAIRLDPNCAQAFFQRALAYAWQGKQGMAIADCSRCARIDPKAAATFFDDIPPTAVVDDQAVALYTEAIRQNPESSEAYYARGGAYSRAGDMDKAMADFTEAIRLGPPAARLYHARGTVFAYRGQDQKAIADYTEAIRLDPQDYPPYNNRSCLYSKMGDGAKAIADATEAIRLAPPGAAHSALYSTRGMAYVVSGQPSKAIGDYTEALRLDPHDGDPHWGRGVAYEQLGNRKKAVADFAEAMRSQVPAATATVGGLTVGLPDSAGAVFSTTPGVGTVTVVGGTDLPSPDYFWLPAYSRMGEPEIRNQLHLSAEQVKKLREITAEYEADVRKAYAETGLDKVRPKEHAKGAEIGRKVSLWLVERSRAAARQIAKVITAEQLAAYKRIVFPSAGYDVLWDREVLRFIGVTPQQRQQFAELAAERQRQSNRRTQQCIDRFLAVLSAEQKRTLRETFDRHAETGGVGYGFGDVRVPASEPEWANLRLPPGYERLTLGSVRRRLDLTTAQEKQLGAISRDFQQRTLDHVDETFGLTPEQWSLRGPGLSHKFEGVIREAQRQVAGLLTPKQAAALKEINFHSAVPATILNSSVQVVVGLGADQKARLKQIADDLQQDDVSARRSLAEKSLGVLTSAQIQRVREELDWRVWSVSRFARPAPGDAGETTGEAAPATRIGEATSDAGTSVFGEEATPGVAAATPAGIPEARVEAYIWDGSAGAPSSDSFWLPVYSELADRAIRKELQLSSEQEKKLRAIAAGYDAEAKKISREVEEPYSKLRWRERNAKSAEITRKTNEKLQGPQKAARKQVEETLSARQIEAYKKLVFPSVAYGLLFTYGSFEGPVLAGVTKRAGPSLDARMLKAIAATQQQAEQLEKLRAKPGQQSRLRRQAYIDRLLAVLDPKQKEKLRAAIEREKHGLPPEEPDQTAAAQQGELQAVTVAYYATCDVLGGDDDGGVTLYLPSAYDGLVRPSARKQLGLSEAQETRLQAIATQFAKAVTNFEDEEWELNKLTPEEQARRNAEIMPVYREEDDTATRQIAALLTPKQAAALPEIGFRNAVVNALSDSRVQKAVGATADQKARLKRLADEENERQNAARQTTIEKALAVLTPVQKQKLREELDRRGW